MSVLYTDIETNNGYASLSFKSFRRIRLGCLISALLFLLPNEMINIIAFPKNNRPGSQWEVMDKAMSAD